MRGARTGRPRVAGLARGARSPSLAAAARLPAAPAARGRASTRRPRPRASSERREAARVAAYWTPARMRSDAAARRRRPRRPRWRQRQLRPGRRRRPSPPTPSTAASSSARAAQRGYCSGTAINSPSRQLVLTAGHCVNSGRAGRRGTASGRATSSSSPPTAAASPRSAPSSPAATTIFAPKPVGQARQPQLRHRRLPHRCPTRAGVNVADAVGGGATIATRPAAASRLPDLRLPGQSAAHAGAATRPTSATTCSPTPSPARRRSTIRCHWAPGASGGGWLIDDGTAINGLTSYGRHSDRVHTFGPYFSSETVGKLVAGM